ncbi:ribonuclease P protein subunit p14-like isoform X2 [Dinothrombium tinctorium]|uniref:Ribonuclease P protein subunit p14-like isoform X2 n=1 Tax=Dinothrombium tinctorium TaxID=1965070 RepID=A0A443RPX2_9ACAR|nr:ribonuclease P protein subunit p14-like isoform X2 [Dinothrombium tinctorium]
MSQRQRFIRHTMPYVYADISLEFQLNDAQSNNIHERTFKIIIMSALKSLFGDVGAAINVDIIKYDSSEKRAFIRFPAKQFVRVRSALTLLSSWEKQNCTFRIHKICHSLSSLPIESFNQHHNVVACCH